MKCLKKMLGVLVVISVIFSMSVTAFAAEPDVANPPQTIIGYYDGPLNDSANSDARDLTAVANVRIHAYAKHDKTDGVQVHIKLYVPSFESVQPEFTGMCGNVNVQLNGGETNTSYFETADGESTIETDVNTGATGNKGDKGTVSISGVATAKNALSGAGVFGIHFKITIPK